MFWLPRNSPSSLNRVQHRATVLLIGHVKQHSRRKTKQERILQFPKDRIKFWSILELENALHQVDRSWSLQEILSVVPALALVRRLVC